MANYTTVFKAEVARLARKEIRDATESIRKASTHHRADIASLKRHVRDLEHQIKALQSGSAAAPTSAPSDGVKTRFSPKWVQADRQRLGLSARKYGLLIGVTGLTIYNWEKESSRPRDKQLAAWANVRQMGKREALKRLETLDV